MLRSRKALLSSKPLKTDAIQTVAESEKLLTQSLIQEVVVSETTKKVKEEPSTVYITYKFQLMPLMRRLKDSNTSRHDRLMSSWGHTEVGVRSDDLPFSELEDLDPLFEAYTECKDHFIKLRMCWYPKDPSFPEKSLGAIEFDKYTKKCHILEKLLKEKLSYPKKAKKDSDGKDLPITPFFPEIMTLYPYISLVRNQCKQLVEDGYSIGDLPPLHLVSSQSLQSMCKELDTAWALFFKHSGQGVRPPSPAKFGHFAAVTFVKSGFKHLPNTFMPQGINPQTGKITEKKKLQGEFKVLVNNKYHKFAYWKSREFPIKAEIKSQSVVKNPNGKYFLTVVLQIPKTSFYKPLPKTNREITFQMVAPSGETRFLDPVEGHTDLSTAPYTLLNSLKAPLPLQEKMALVKAKDADLTEHRKVYGYDEEYEKKKLSRAQTHANVQSTRKFWHYQLARELCKYFDKITLIKPEGVASIKEAQKDNGLQVSDRGFTDFILVLTHICNKTQKEIVVQDS